MLEQINAKTPKMEAQSVRRELRPRGPLPPQLHHRRQLLLHAYNRNGVANTWRIEEIKLAIPLVTDQAIIVSASLMVKALVVQLRAAMRSIADVDTEISKICSSHSDFEIFASFPGAGPTLAPRLLAAFGWRRERFASAQETQQLFGIAPAIEASGKQYWVRWRFLCPKFLRQSFH